MQKLDSGLEITPEYVLSNNLQDKLTISLDGVDLNLDSVVSAITGENGSIKQCDWPKPEIKEDEIVYHTLNGNVEAYITD